MRESTSAAEAFTATVMPSLDLVHNLSRRLLRGSADAEDLAQDTLAKAWEAWTRGVRPDSAGAWMSTICLNLARDHGRRSAHRPEAAWPEGFDRADSVDVEAAAITRVHRRLVDEALWTLPEPQRIAIVLMDICGLTAAETAVITDAPRGTVPVGVADDRHLVTRQIFPFADALAQVRARFADYRANADAAAQWFPCA